MPRTTPRQAASGTFLAATASVAMLVLLVTACAGTTPAAPAASPAPSATTIASKLPPENGPGYQVDVKPEDFPTSTKIDNRFSPLVPGTRRIYEGTTADGPERTVVEVTRDTKTIMGVPAVVVHDTVSRAGTLIEDTYDWYAQDKAGNVWYFGEDTRALDEKTGQLTDTAGAWEAGVNGAQPGLIMKAQPAVGQSFYQEYFRGEAEDQADVIRTGESIAVKYGNFADTVRTKDYTALDTSVVENKVYASGVGFIYVEHVAGAPEKVELVAIEKF